MNEEALGNTVHVGGDLSAANLSNDELWEEHEGLGDFQYSAGDNSQQQPPTDIVLARFTEIEALIANGELPEFVDSVHEGPYSQGNVDNTFNPPPDRVDSGQPTTVNERGMDSAHGTTSSPSQTIRAPTAPNGLGNNIYNPGFDNTQGVSGDRSPVVSTVVENSAVVENVRVIESDDGNKEDEQGSEEGNEDEDVPNYVNFETFQERDPAIVENPQRTGYGRTGMRNGHQVWFNPTTGKWRK